MFASSRSDRTGRLLHFDEAANMDPENYAFVNKHNEEHFRNASRYLTDHPEYRRDLIDP